MEDEKYPGLFDNGLVWFLNFTLTRPLANFDYV